MSEKSTKPRKRIKQCPWGTPDSRANHAPPPRPPLAQRLDRIRRGVDKLPHPPRRTNADDPLLFPLFPDQEVVCHD